MFSIWPERLCALSRRSAFRQSIGLLSIFSLITLLAWVGTYLLVVREIDRLMEQRLDDGAIAAVTVLDQSGILPAPSPGQVLALVGADKSRQGNDLLQQVLLTAPLGYSRYDERGPHRPDWQLLVMDTKHGRLLIGEDVERLEEVTEILFNGLLIALTLSFSTAMLAALWIARRNQARIDKISQGLEYIAAGQLNEHILLAEPQDDLSLLAERINATTKQLQTLMTQMRSQTSNIAHDLRTPLARLRALIEEQYIALSMHKEPPSEQALASALAQTDRLVETFNALLRISRIESGARKSEFVSLNLGTLAQEVHATYMPVVEDKGQRLAISINQAAMVRGDKELLVQLLANLLQNALRYGAPDQTITLSVDGTRLSLTDQGPGIAAAERDKALQPLYQLDRERQGEGYGLGLAIVSAIADLHDARLALSEGSDGIDGMGLCVTVEFANFTDL